MSHQVKWNKIVLEEFIELANLTEAEEIVIRTRVAGWSRLEQCERLGISTATLDRIIKRLKLKYDDVSQYSVLLPPRKHTNTWE